MKHLYNFNLSISINESLDRKLIPDSKRIEHFIKYALSDYFLDEVEVDSKNKGCLGYENVTVDVRRKRTKSAKKRK